jgi:hypothetical protein
MVLQALDSVDWALSSSSVIKAIYVTDIAIEAEFALRLISLLIPARVLA